MSFNRSRTHGDLTMLVPPDATDGGRIPNPREDSEALCDCKCSRRGFDCSLARGRRYENHGNASITDELLGDAPEQEPPDTAPAMTRDQDDVTRRQRIFRRRAISVSQACQTRSPACGDKGASTHGDTPIPSP